MSESIQLATFGAGCFWGVEADFLEVEGVLETAVGFMGGHVENPSYKQVCMTDTGHVEVVHLSFDASVVTYAELLAKFFSIHDPTQVNRQGPDVGWQYRSVVYYHDETQKAQAEATIAALEEGRRFPRKIATAVEPAATFWRAEEYHQRYFEKNGIAHCRTR